ncbi:uncharacterized protein LOC117181350 isoform X2 [Belonocnema kinseyi]|nr:uncharacterized protein LOC117181350 isoform X2 [Belonocnema kinseyi]
MDGIEDKCLIKEEAIIKEETIVKEELDLGAWELTQEEETSRVINSGFRFDLRENPENERRARNSGKAYLNRHGQLVPAKSMKKSCTVSSRHSCNLDCAQKLIPESRREKIFQYFWNLPDRFKKYEFICRHVRLIQPRKRKLNPSTSKMRNYSRFYFLPLGGKLVRVCRTTFTATLDINEQWLSTAFKKFGHLSSGLQLEESELELENVDQNSTEEFETKLLFGEPDPLDIQQAKDSDKDIFDPDESSMMHLRSRSLAEMEGIFNSREVVFDNEESDSNSDADDLETHENSETEEDAADDFLGESGEEILNKAEALIPAVAESEKQRGPGRPSTILREEPVILRRSRKRKRQPHTHKHFLAKQKVERGLQRTTASGKVIPAKKFVPQIACTCGFKCDTKIDILRQKEIFCTYWEQSNKVQKTLLIRECVEKIPVAHKRDPHLPLISLRKVEFNFHFFLLDGQGVRQKVCRPFFLQCFQVSPSTMARAVNGASTNPSASERRGKHVPKNKTSEEARKNVIEFINRFPTYESHYGRSSSENKYLNSNLNIATMHRMYKENCVQDDVPSVSETIFRQIFNEEFNLCFKRPHTDMCKTCDIIKNEKDNLDLTQEERKSLEEMEKQHNELKGKVSKDFENDVNKSQKTSSIRVLTFGLQKVLATPALSTNVAFYKRQLATYNCCIYDETARKAYMYIWSENVASRGGEEIGSCLLKHLKTNIPDETDRIVLYSDCCGGQNRNIKVILLLKHFMFSSKIDLIEHKFLCSGHSYNSCDRNFSYIEKEKRKHDGVYDPDHWIEIISQARKTEPKFVVTKMEKNDFFSTQELEQLITNRKNDTENRKINWLSARVLKHDKEQLFSVYMIDNDNILHRLNIAKKNITEQEFGDVKLSLLYLNGNTITKKKYEDLIELCKFIPQKYRHFYKNLRMNDLEKDFDLASGGESDEE